MMSLKKKSAVINETSTFQMKSSVFQWDNRKAFPAGQPTETVGQGLKAVSQAGSQILQYVRVTHVVLAEDMKAARLKGFWGQWGTLGHGQCLCAVFRDHGLRCHL